jgi:acetyl-CoA carboxylase carboxyl transferase subunit beta
MDDFFQDRKTKVEVYRKYYRGKRIFSSKVNIPNGIFIKCEKCNETLFSDDYINNDYVCLKCNYHSRISARYRLKITTDENSFEELFANLKTLNPLNHPGYIEKLEQSQSASSEDDAFVAGLATITGIKVAIGVMDSFFMMGSMGSVVGEKITRLIEVSITKKLPLIIFSASGGARMQEGMFSLMQMAKTSAAIGKLDEAGILFISVLTNPTTGGVYASYASLGDIIISEPDALIGFAGKRVIEQTIGQVLPQGFQSAEFQEENGFVDFIENRENLKNKLAKILELHERR